VDESVKLLKFFSFTEKCGSIVSLIRPILLFSFFQCRKMFPTSSKKSSGWEKLRCVEDKENRQPDHNYCLPSSHSSTSSCSSSRFLLSPITDENNNNLTYAIPTYLNNNNVSDGIGSCSSGYDSRKSPSPPPPPFKVHEDDQISRSFDSLLMPLQSYTDNSSSSSSSPPSITYSPLSSFNFADPSNAPSAFFSDFDFG
jgi:hypothetical protein